MNVLDGKILVRVNSSNIVPERFKHFHEAEVVSTFRGSEVNVGDVVVYRGRGVEVRIDGVDYVLIDETTVDYAR